MRRPLRRKVALVGEPTLAGAKERKAKGMVRVSSVQRVPGCHPCSLEDQVVQLWRIRVSRVRVCDKDEATETAMIWRFDGTADSHSRPTVPRKSCTYAV